MKVEQGIQTTQKMSFAQTKLSFVWISLCFVLEVLIMYKRELAFFYRYALLFINITLLISPSLTIYKYHFTNIIITVFL